MNSSLPLMEVIHAQKRGEAKGIASICSANAQVLEASFAHALANHLPLLIESTCNQVNQYGGYTGQTPGQFMASLMLLSKGYDFPAERLIVGGDHLGPSPWQEEAAAIALEKARRLVRECVRAGYVKIHLDASMRCADDDPARQLPTKIAAERSAELALAAEEAYRDQDTMQPAPLYVIGTEVPAPGGALEAGDELAVTRPKEVAQTIEVTKSAFFERGMEDAWQRVIAVVVQPGVEFGDDSLHAYDRRRARPLARYIEGQDRLVYEAHSTDYQTPAALRQLVKDHFAILKVGPALTFAKREAVFALASIEEELLKGKPGVSLSRLREVLEEAMRADPIHWRRHYHGSDRRQRLARKYSFSDRIRYYWTVPLVRAALDQLRQNLSAVSLPPTLLSQFLPDLYPRIRAGKIEAGPEAIIHAKIGAVLDDYAYACGYT